MAKILIGAAILAAGLLIPVAPALLPLMMGICASGLSMIVAGVAQKIMGQHSPGVGIAVKQAAAPWNIVYGRSRLGGVVIYLNTYGTENVALDLIAAHVGHECQMVGNNGRPQYPQYPQGGLYLDGKEVLIDANGNASGLTLTDFSGNTYCFNFNGVYWVSWFSRLGGADNDNFPIQLKNGNDPNWNTYTTYRNCFVSGRAYSYIRLVWNAQVFANGEPGIRVDILGKNDIYDPRTGLRGYTENWALCVADYLCNAKFGLGCNYATEIDEEALIAAANICDEQVAVRYSNLPGWLADTPFTYGTMIAPGNGYAYMCVQSGVTGLQPPAWPTQIDQQVWDGPGPGGTQAVHWNCQGVANTNLFEPRYTMNGTFQTDSSPGDVLNNMMTAAAGRMVYIAGRWKIMPAAWPGTGLAIGDDDLIGPVKWLPARKYRDLVNAIKGTFICPTYPYINDGPGLPLNLRDQNVFDGMWQPTDFPAYAQDMIHGYPQDNNYLADGSVTLWQDLRLPFTISAAAAQRIAKIYLLRNRQQGTGTLQTKLSVYQAQALDVLQWTRPSLNFSNKLVEISNFRFKVDYDTVDPSEGGSGGEQHKAPTLSCELDVQETAPSVYAWSSNEELPMNSQFLSN